MIDYKYELGPLLTKVLTIIKASKEPITRDELSQILKVSPRITNDYLESLYKREYIIDSRGDWHDSKTGDEIFNPQESEWIVSAEGLNYLDLHRYWWTRFWTRSILCPLIVSLVVSIITSINAEKINDIFKSICAVL